MTVQASLSFIYRHSKLLLSAIGIAFIISLFLFGVSAKDRHASASTHNEKYFKCIDIEADDTLWAIAESYISEEYTSVDAYIEEVMSINGLTSEKIYCGATLIIPYYAPPQ